MKLSTRGRYAVMAMADIGLYGGQGPMSLADIADRQKISLSYLEQLFSKLRRAGLVKSIRGPGGGYELGFALGETRIADIISAVDEPMTATRCTPGRNSGCVSRSSRCLTHDLWEELSNQIRLYLSSITLADVCEGRVLGTSGVFRADDLERPDIVGTGHTDPQGDDLLAVVS